MSAVPVKIMIVDDEPKMRNLLRIGLSMQGYDVLESPNGTIAIDLLKQEPKLIILDLGLPDVPGHDLLRDIRAGNSSVPIIVLSSRGDEAGKVEALDIGADDYLTKPPRMNELLARVRTALRRQMRAQGERPVFRVGNLSVDLGRRLVKVGDNWRRLPASRSGRGTRNTTWTLTTDVVCHDRRHSFDIEALSVCSTATYSITFYLRSSCPLLRWALTASTLTPKSVFGHKR